MIQVTRHMRIFVATEPADFRKGIDGLARECKLILDKDPFSGAVFVFRNRRRSAIKILVYDGQGFWLCMKRLSQGKFRHWPSQGHPATPLEAHELQVLLSGGDPLAAPGSPSWKRISQPE